MEEPEKTPKSKSKRRYRRLRPVLGPETATNSALKTLDIFAMPQPLSAKGERLWRKAMKQIARDRKDRRLNRPRNRDL